MENYGWNLPRLLLPPTSEETSDVRSLSLRENLGAAAAFLASIYANGTVEPFCGG